MADIVNLALSEGGVFTAAQAARLNIPSYALTYAVKAGAVERLRHGAYRLSSTLDDGLDDLRALYKLTSPSKWTHERIASFDGVAVSDETAAYIWGIGEFYASPYVFAVPKRFNSRGKDARYCVQKLGTDDVFWQSGIPITRIERTLSNLYEHHEDLSLLAHAFIDAVNTYGSTKFDMRLLARLMGGRGTTELLAASGLDGQGKQDLIELDDLGHVAIIDRRNR